MFCAGALVTLSRASGHSARLAIDPSVGETMNMRLVSEIIGVGVQLGLSARGWRVSQCPDHRPALAGDGADLLSVGLTHRILQWQSYSRGSTTCRSAC